MDGKPEQNDDERRARLRARRLGLGVVMVAAVAFIAASTWQIVSAVFGLGTTPLSAGPGDTTERRCAEGIAQLAHTLEAPAPGTSPRNAPRSGWRDVDDVEAACRVAPGGVDAWDALLRLRQAQDQLAEGASDDLQPLRNEVAAHLPADLR